MIIETINPGVHKVKLRVKSLIHGNDVIDRYTGYDKFKPTLLKVRCDDCTLMVFGEKDMALFEDITEGSSFKALVHDGRYENVYKFKYFIESKNK